MLQYSSCVYSMIIQSQLTPAVHCVLSTSKNMLPFVLTNNNAEKYVIPLIAMLALKTVSGQCCIKLLTFF
jgi:hypothetical protein